MNTQYTSLPAYNPSALLGAPAQAIPPKIPAPYALAGYDHESDVLLVVPIPVEVATRYAKATGFLPASIQILPTAYTFSFVAQVNLSFSGAGRFVGDTSFEPTCIGHAPSGEVTGIHAHVFDTFTIN